MLQAPTVTAFAALALVAPATSAPALRHTMSRPPITQRSTGKTIRLARGASATLRLSNRWRWGTPRVSTKAIELIPVEYFVDPGFREWKVEARTRGRSTIRSLGTPNCENCVAHRFRVTIVVGTA